MKESNMAEAVSQALDAREFDRLVFKRAVESVSTELDGEAVILDMEAGLYSGLNEVGTVLWNLLEKQVNFVTMCDTVSSDFDVSFEECAEDIFTFLKVLHKNKLIEVSIEANT